MNHATIRDAIIGVCDTSDAPAKMFSGPVDKTDYADWVNTLIDETTGKVLFGWVTREGFSDTQTVDASDAPIVDTTRENWAIYLFHPFKSEVSEDYFQAALDSLMKVFRFEHDLNGKTFRSYPLQIPDIAMVMLGNLLCHRAKAIIVVSQRLLTNS